MAKKVSNSKCKKAVQAALKGYLKAWSWADYDCTVLGRHADDMDEDAWEAKYEITLQEGEVSPMLYEGRFRKLCYNYLEAHDVVEMDLDRIESDLKELLRRLPLARSFRERTKEDYPADKALRMRRTVLKLFEQAPLIAAGDKRDPEAELAKAYLEHGITEAEVDAAIALQLARR
jgi:hypothetical protein